MKKYTCAIFLGLAGMAMVFGGDFSLNAGAGGLLGGFFTRYTLTADGKIEGERIKIDATQEMNQFNYGFFAFFDVIYRKFGGEFSVSYQNGENTYKETADISVLTGGANDSGKGWESALGFSLLGKYLLSLNERLIIFPLLGIEYQIALSQERTQADGWVYDRTDGLREKDKDGKAYRLEDWNSFWINVGGGLDFALTENFLVRGELIYGFRLLTSYETKNLNLMKSQAGDPNPKLTGLTSGPSLRICAGYRFL